MIAKPTNLLYANTATTHASGTAKASTRKVRSRVPASTRKIGIIDVSAKAGLLYDVLERVNRKQSRYIFYPVEASLPMGVGLVGDTLRETLKSAGSSFSRAEWDDIATNLAVQDLLPYLESTRLAVGVDVLVGLVAPLLAWTEEVDDALHVYWGHFSFGKVSEVVVSAHELRDLASQAKRPFEAAMAMLILTQIWHCMYGPQFHDPTLGCAFDDCKNREDLVGALKKMEICSECLEQIPEEERPAIQKCMDAIRDYQR